MRQAEIPAILGGPRPEEPQALLQRGLAPDLPHAAVLLDVADVEAAPGGHAGFGVAPAFEVLRYRKNNHYFKNATY
jgi:hypothetical protein